MILVRAAMRNELDDREMMPIPFDFFSIHRNHINILDRRSQFEFEEFSELEEVFDSLERMISIDRSFFFLDKLTTRIYISKYQK